ncbi:serine/threonine-protein kinase [Polyangium sp. y55x31]|uniref:serine/threonine-protein kinase n=1 Tax=Polyangium sp. y55x31 TaxID=3042688 RepID=UPI002482720B|nr:serine/threonine-protein kinase [Polyangium sp. y55x31]MDI1482231.1 serine/threonine-protein kinase [Polyangium sp. y55x31]
MTEPAERDPASPDGAPAPGTVLAGKYVVESVLGQGGMGIVLQARHQRTEQAVAIKLLRPDARALPDVTARFEREARAAARIQGPHVVRVYDVDNLPDGSPMMVMELLQGWDLGQELAIRGPLPYPEAVGHVLAACEALAQAHRMGVVHRDIKPGNLYLCQEGQRRVVKVLDFGISKVLDKRDNAAQTATTAAFGTPQYMSPEQVRSTKNVDGRADIWSLGVVLYELLGGRGPFGDEASATAVLAAIIADEPKPLRELRPDLPQKLADVVMKALAKRVDERWPDIDTFMAALVPFGPAGAAPQTLLNAKTPAIAAREPMSTRRLVIVSAGIAAVVVGVFLFVLASQTKKPAEPAADTVVTTATAPTPAATPAPSPTITPTPAAAAETGTTPAAATVPAPTTSPVVGPAPKKEPTTATPPVNATATAAPTPTPKPPKPPPPPAEDPTHL